ncbi:Structural maintenance of chromosomes protein 5 [Tilletia horrida]|nr:Structural maintenance of chromosomes protein 5 [Tilletia horrida]
MPDVSRTRAATQVNGRHADDQDEDYDTALPGGSLPVLNGLHRKRGRATMEGNGQQGSEDEDEAEENAARMAKRKKQRELAIERTMQTRDDDGYLPGSIVRVKLIAFVTYDAVEFRPGPYLNMIIGPNGTGKSTIVCAIALGLGWKPNVLGRAKDVAAFVKQGYDTSSITIELKGKPGQRNLIIRRDIGRHNNQSDWFLDGQKTTQRDIDSRVEALDIKIDNLCSFLPQDKVADFARMTPPQLLKEVQKAAGETGLIESHEELTRLGHEEAKLSQRLANEQSDLDDLNQRQSMMERDVQRFRERQEIERRVKLLELRVPEAKYNLARAEAFKLKTRVQKRRARLEVAEQRLKPYEEVLGELDEKSEKLRLRKDKAKSSLDAVAGDLKKCTAALEKKEKAAENLHREMATLDQRETQRKKEIEKLKGEIRDLKAAIQNPPETVSTQSSDTQVKQIRMRIRADGSERSDIKMKIDEIHLENRSLRSTLDDARRKLENLDNNRHQRFVSLEHVDQSIGPAVRWLRDNKQLFSGTVYEPVAMEASIKDNKYANAVETCMSWPSFKTFVCELRSDYDIFTRELIDKQKLRLNVYEVEGFDDSLTSSAYPQELLNQYGFESTAIELIDAPDAIKKFLSQTHALNKIPISLNSNPSAQLLDQITSQRLFQRFVFGNQLYNVTISSYGNRSASTATRNLKASRNFGQPVDQTLKQDLERRIRENSARFRASEEEVAKLMDRDKILRNQIEQHEKQRNALQAEYQAAKAAQTQYEKDRGKLDMLERHLRNAMNKPTTERERMNIRKQLQKLAEDRAGIAQDIKVHMLDQNKLRMNYDLQFLEGLQHEANRVAFSELKSAADASQEHWKTAVDEIVEEERDARRRAKSLLNRFNNLSATSDPEVIVALQEAREQPDYNDVSLDDLQLELEAQRQALDQAHGLSDEVIATFEERARQIQKHSDKIAAFTKEKADLDQNIKDIRDEWEPAIRSLVHDVSEKFSAAFDRIGCAGEIRVATDRDYDKWGIEILVKFRDTEELQLLTGQRQSGGERSLSTIMFLMGLTELGKSPFSLVDEINQGMDQRAERAVHNQMVDVTCGQHARQYFLITPKLLNHLAYHERMRVLIINNGEWLPEKFSFKSVLRKHLQRAQRPTASQA